MGNSPSTPDQGKSKRTNANKEEDVKAARAAIAATKRNAEEISRREAVSLGSPQLPPKNGEFVWTPFGPGVVNAFDQQSQIYHVIPAWRVDPGGDGPQRAELEKVHAYLNMESVTKDTKVKENGREKTIRATALGLLKNVYPAGQRVSSPFGAGEIVEYDIGAGNYQVSLDWELDGGRHAIVFAQPDVVKREVRAKKGDVVLTPYGTGVMKGVRPVDGCHVVNIKQVAGEATAYLSPDAILRQLPATVGSWVMSNFGPAYILGYRQEDHVYTVVLPYAIGYIQADQISGPYTPPKKGDDSCAVM